MKVRANQNGFYGGTRIRAGEEFEVPSSAKAKWFAPVLDLGPAKAKPKTKPKAEEVDLSELIPDAGSLVS